MVNIAHQLINLFNLIVKNINPLNSKIGGFQFKKRIVYHHSTLIRGCTKNLKNSKIWSLSLYQSSEKPNLNKLIIKLRTRVRMHSE